jgi:hypothetical protein
LDERVIVRGGDLDRVASAAPEGAQNKFESIVPRASALG